MRENLSASIATEQVEKINKKKQTKQIQNKPEWLNEGPRVARVHLDRDRWVSGMEMENLNRFSEIYRVVLQINPILSGSFSEEYGDDGGDDY